MGEDYSSTSLAEIPLDAEPRSLVAPNFTILELTKSATAERRGIDNSFPSRAEFEAALHLSREILQPIREAFGPFSPNSVFRCQALERALKGKPADWVSDSQHTKGEACDIEVPGKATLELARWVEDHLTFDQLICECYDPRKGPNSGWVHVSLKPPGGRNRREVLSYIKSGESQRYVFVPGLRESIA